jgi:hypothetical protein
MKEVDFNGYSFDDPKMRKCMKFLVVRSGDLDINNCYAFQSKKALTSFLKGESIREIYAIFEIKEFRPEKNNKK